MRVPWVISACPPPLPPAAETWRGRWRQESSRGGRGADSWRRRRVCGGVLGGGGNAPPGPAREGREAEGAAAACVAAPPSACRGSVGACSVVLRNHSGTHTGGLAYTAAGLWNGVPFPKATLKMNFSPRPFSRGSCPPPLPRHRLPERVSRAEATRTPSERTGTMLFPPAACAAASPVAWAVAAGGELSVLCQGQSAALRAPLPPPPTAALLAPAVRGGDPRALPQLPPVDGPHR